MIENKGLISL